MRKARPPHSPAWQEYFDKRHAHRLAAMEKKKATKFARLKADFELATKKQEQLKEMKMTISATEVKLPKNAAEQAALAERQAKNIERAKTLKTRFDAKVQGLKDAREQMLASMSPALRKKYEADIDAKNDFESKIADIRAEFHEDASTLRTEVNAINAALKETAKYLADPITAADSYMIGSPRRDSIARSLDGAGPRKLADMFMTARLTEDLELGAEVLRAIERTDKKYRPFPPSAVAETLFGHLVAGVSERAKTAEFQYATIHELMADVEGVRPMSIREKMVVALDHRDKGRILPPDSEESNSGVTATGKIARGLAAQNAA